MKSRIRVALLAIESFALEPLLACAPDVDLVARASLRSAHPLELAVRAPDVAVFDLRCAKAEELLVYLSRVRDLAGRARVVVVGDPGNEEVARGALRVGAAAYLGTEVTRAAVASALRAAVTGQLHLGSTGKRVAQRLLGAVS